MGHGILHAGMAVDILGKGRVPLPLNVGSILAAAFCLPPSSAVHLAHPSSKLSSVASSQSSDKCCIILFLKVPAGVESCPDCLLAGATSSTAARSRRDRDWERQGSVWLAASAALFILSVLAPCLGGGSGKTKVDLAGCGCSLGAE